MAFIKHNWYVLLVLFLLACQTKREYTSKPTKSIINKENDLLEVNTVIFHQSDTVTTVYLEIRNENLLYKYNDTASVPYAELKVIYLLKDSKRHVVDSGSVILNDRSQGEILIAKSIFAKLNIKARSGNNYQLRIETIDLNKKVRYFKHEKFLKADNLNKQNFLVIENEAVSFKSSFTGTDKAKLVLNSQVYTTVLVDCFFKEFSIALPPFSNKEREEINWVADSSYNLLIQNKQQELILAKKGFYHFRLDEKSKVGLTLLSFDKAFPGVHSSEDMINCTRYIMTKEEFLACKNAVDKKGAIDKFWLELGGSKERAKELLKRYYNRVQEANKLYTSYFEGWKNDRGMIFIVFGQPNSVLTREDEEVWIYGSPVNQSTTTFIFKKIDMPYSDNVYELERSSLYKPAWSDAVDQWRQGIYFEGRR